MMTTMLAALTTTLASPPAPAHPVVAELDAIVHGARPCTDLRVRYRETDGLGGATTVTIASGRVFVRTERLGLAPIESTGFLAPKVCYDLSLSTVRGAFWRERPRRPAAIGLPRVTLRIGVGYPRADSLEISLTERQLAKAPAFQRMAALLALARAAAYPKKSLMSSARPNASR